LKGGVPSLEAAAMKKLSDHQRAARRHNTDESGESLREVVKAGKKPETKSRTKAKKTAKSFREADPTQDRPSKLKD
jgi:Spy/CpxP family protein refolding chaperone